MLLLHNLKLLLEVLDFPLHICAFHGGREVLALAQSLRRQMIDFVFHAGQLLDLLVVGRLLLQSVQFRVQTVELVDDAVSH